MSLLHSPARDRAMLVGVGLDEARIHRKAFAADKPGHDACPDHTFKNAAENIAVAEALVARARERRMIGDPVFDAEVTKPAIGEVELDLAAECSFRADGKHVADDEHPDHQHRINRGAA